MANCEEKSCVNVQSAICLHCNLRLCAPHIIAHGTTLLEEANELCEQINKLAEHLDVSLQQIHTTRNEAMNVVDIWRQRQIDKIEDKYAEKVQAIESRQDYLVQLENKLSQRLAKDAREPLERMQIQRNANGQVIQGIRQVIADIKQESAHLQWPSSESSNQFSSFHIENAAISTSQQYYQIQPYDQHQYNTHLPENYVGAHTSMNSFSNQWHSPYQLNQSSPENFPSLMNVVPTVNTFTNVPPYPLMNSSGFSPLITPQYAFNQTGASSPQYWSQPTVPFATADYRVWSAPTTAGTASTLVPPPQKSTFSTGLQINIKRLPTSPCVKLINFFMNVSGSSDHLLNNFITNNLHRAVHVNNMMLLLLSFLEAWHSKHSPTIFNERVLSYHIFTVKKYINGRDHELTVIAAILVFINSFGHDEIRSGQIMIVLLQHFFDHKCITKATILDWYENGASYGYNNFQKAKLWAQPFINQLNTDVQSK